MLDIPITKRNALTRAFAEICACIAINRPDMAEEIMVSCTHDIVKREPDEAVHFLISWIHNELPGYINEPYVVATLEMLEGMLALRRIIRENGLFMGSGLL